MTMRLIIYLVAVLAMGFPYSEARYKGFNIRQTNPDNSTKTTAEYEQTFVNLKALPQKIDSVRLYSSSGPGGLGDAVPAAIKTNTKILVGLWVGATFQSETAALMEAITTYGHDWILAISVGSEDLYRGDISASALATMINNTRAIVRDRNVTALVGHVDTWGTWVDTSNSAVISATDFLGMDGYPYWQNSSIADAPEAFWQSVNQTRAAASNKPVWVTETGWPISGATMGSAVASLENARHYWRHVACQAFKSINIFWYVDQDVGQSPAFGIFNSPGNPSYDFWAC